MALVEDDVVPLKVVVVEEVNVGDDHAVGGEADAALFLHPFEALVALHLARAVKRLSLEEGGED